MVLAFYMRLRYRRSELHANRVFINRSRQMSPKVLVYGYRFASFHLVLCLLVGTLIAPRALAWGERGHAVVTRVAARLILARQGGDFGDTLLARELMLTHIANVPDIVWRNMGRDVAALNGPTHYGDLEYYGSAPVLAQMPLSIQALAHKMIARCAESAAVRSCPRDAHGHPTASMAGTAPFRIRQFFAALKQKLTRLANDEKTGHTPHDVKKDTDQVLVAAGLLSHFVADLGNPDHTTRDYDGYAVGEGGIHAYFETDIVNAYSLTLAEEVYKTALARAPFAQLLKPLPASQHADPLVWAYQLALDSYRQLGPLSALDRRYAVLKLGSTDDTHGPRTKARRRPARDAAPAFHDLVVKRLALAADATARFWTEAWNEAGRPQLLEHLSYVYPLAPDFVKPDYLQAAAR